LLVILVPALMILIHVAHADYGFAEGQMLHRLLVAGDASLAGIFLLESSQPGKS